MSPLPTQDRTFLEEVYQLLFTSRMNAIYYEKRLAFVGRLNFWLELLLAVSASSSAVAGLAFWNTTTWGKWLWTAVTTISAVVAICKPLYPLAKKIEVFTRQRVSYQQNFFLLQKLNLALRQDGRITPEHRKQYEAIFERHMQLSGEDETPPRLEVQLAAEAEAARVVPAEAFWSFWAEMVEKNARPAPPAA